MNNKCHNIRVFFIDEKAQLATVNFMDTKVTMPVPLEVLRDKIREGFYIPQSETLKRDII